MQQLKEGEKGGRRERGRKGVKDEQSTMLLGEVVSVFLRAKSSAPLQRNCSSSPGPER